MIVIDFLWYGNFSMHDGTSNLGDFEQGTGMRLCSVRAEYSWTMNSNRKILSEILNLAKFDRNYKFAQFDTVSKGTSKGTKKGTKKLTGFVVQFWIEYHLRWNQNSMLSRQTSYACIKCAQIVFTFKYFYECVPEKVIHLEDSSKKYCLYDLNFHQNILLVISLGICCRWESDHLNGSTMSSWDLYRPSAAL